MISVEWRRNQQLCGASVEDMDFEAQNEQLLAQAEAQGIDVRPIAGLPDDPRLKIVALATLLRIDPMAALRGAVPAKRLVADARKRDRALEQYERQERKRLKDLGIEIQEEGAER